MANPILNALFRSVGGAVVDAAKLGVLPGFSNTVGAATTRKKKKTVGCTPCAAKARVAEVRRMVRGGR